ncbi:MBL fold metallo-hydrolase [bacterium]|nr:MBL fold metallo-hydrolase [bacterium]
MSYERSEHFDGSKFFNPGAPSPKSFLDVLKWQWTSEKKPWPDRVELEPQPPPTSPNSGQASTTYINHATHLVQISGINFLTDPIFSNRASPFSWLGPKRVHPPAIELNDLPEIHFVVISHNHYDHMDVDSIRQLSERNNPVFIVPLGNEKLIRAMGAKQVIELDWWQSHNIEKSNVLVTLTPAHHWSARGLFDRNEALWGGYVIDSKSLKIFFAGDTGYSKIFSEIKDRLGPFDLSIIPIGAYEPRWFMKEHHVNPEEAVQIHIDLGSKISIGTHFGTFQLTDEGRDEPEQHLKEALLKRSLPLSIFKVPKPGESFLVEGSLLQETKD